MPSQMRDFCSWIVDHRTDDPAVADLIERARNDERFPAKGSFAHARLHLERHCAEPAMLRALDEALEAWKDEASFPGWMRGSRVRFALHAHRSAVYSVLLLVIVGTSIVPGTLGAWLMTGAIALIILPLVLGI